MLVLAFAKGWGKRACDRCPFCGNTQTLLHVLSNCQVALDQGRFTWRHNSVLSNVILLVKSALIPTFRLYSDLPGFLAPGGGSIPPHVLVTNLKPDLFIVDDVSRIAVLFELTCPWDGNIDRSHAYKEDRYAPLIADLSRSYTTYHFSVEVSVRGQVTTANKSRLKAFVYRVSSDPKRVFKELIPVISKISLLSSFSIFSARNEPSWTNPATMLHH